MLFYESSIFIIESVANAFSTPDGTTFDFVINCASETKLGQTEAVSKSINVDYMIILSTVHSHMISNVINA
jgi:hypothetical protein